MGKNTQEAIIAVIETKLSMYKEIVDELKQLVQNEHEAHSKIYDAIKMVDEKHTNRGDRVLKYMYMAGGAILALEFLFKFIWK